MWRGPSTLGLALLLSLVLAALASADPALQFQQVLGEGKVEDLAGVGSRLVFFGPDPPSGTEIWGSDGTAAGTSMLADLNTDNSWRPGVLSLGTRALFVNDGSQPGLWATDGTSAGTELLAAGLDATVRIAATVGGVGYFPAGFESNAGSSGLWRSDGTAAGTWLVKHLAFGSPSGGYAYTGIVAAGNRVFFAADDGEHGLELWRSDGTAAGTQQIADGLSGPGGLRPTSMTAYGDDVVFGPSPTAAPAGIWRTIGGGTGLIQLKAFADPGTFVREFAADSTGFYALTGDAGFDLAELWHSDGTAAGTTLLRTFERCCDSIWERRLSVDVDGSLFFAAYSGSEGLEPWCSDGTARGTRLLADIAPEDDPSYPAHFVNAGGTVLFDVAGDEGSRVWQTDGTPAGTVQVAPSRPPLGSDVDLSLAGDRLVYSAVGGGLWTAPAPAPVSPAARCGGPPPTPVVRPERTPKPTHPATTPGPTVTTAPTPESLAAAAREQMKAALLALKDIRWSAGRLRFTQALPLGGRVGWTLRLSTGGAKPHRWTLGRSSAVVKPGSRTTRIAINRRGRALLRAHPRARLGLAMIAVLSDSLGEVTANRSLKPPPHPRG